MLSHTGHAGEFVVTHQGPRGWRLSFARISSIRDLAHSLIFPIHHLAHVGDAADNLGDHQIVGVGVAADFAKYSACPSRAVCGASLSSRAKRRHSSHSLPTNLFRERERYR